MDLGAACSFVTERLAQQLRLPGRKNNIMIAGIAGVNITRACGVVSLIVEHVRGGRKIYVHDAFVLSRVTRDMPTNQIEYVDKRKHLAGLDLSHLEFKTPT